MATPQILQSERDILMWKSLFEIPRDRGNVKSRGKEIEAKIEFLESLNGKVSNRRSRRWLNDRLLMELVPPLNAEEIRGLFAPPPWGDEVPPSPFSLTNTGDWDKFRTIDMDKEASMIEVLEGPKNGERNRGNADKVAVLTAWHRVDCRTREVLRRSFHSDLVKGYEEKLRTFIKDEDDDDGAALVLHVQDPFRRLLLHGLCEFYDLVSVTETTKSEGRDSLKITRIKKKKKKAEGVIVLPNITLCNFLSMAKQGKW